MDKEDVNIKVELGPEVLEESPEESGEDDDDEEMEESEMQDEAIVREEAARKANICLNCGLEVVSKQDLIEHIGQNADCLHHYGDKGIEKLKSDVVSREISVKYQEDDNIACAPVVEEGCSKLDHSMIEDIRTLPAGRLEILGDY